MKIKKFSRQLLGVALTMSMMTNGATSLYAQDLQSVLTNVTSDVHSIVVDGEKVDIDANTFKGFGAVTCNNTSRLLLDYKEEQPEQYWKIMNLLFNPETGAGLNHVKVEMGGDVNSSSGTEPSTMRSAEEEANVLRGAGWHFAADAKSINPDITVEMLRWGEPAWTQEGRGYEEYANPKFEARYQWYKQTIEAVYNEFGIKVNYVSPSQNERTGGYDDNFAWIKYCAKRLNEDGAKADALYDYSDIKIVAADTHTNSNETASRMLADKELMELIDVVSDHYQLRGNANLTKVNQQYGKEVWYSEGVAPMINAKYRINVDEERGGVGGKVGMADLATRFINSYNYAGAGDNPARMTRFEYQPAVGAFYEGSAYSPKHLIGAFDPWSGYYEADGGIQMTQHFMLFAEIGWNYLPDACYGDGDYTDGGVSLDTGTHNYMTVKDPETDDYSMMFANNTSQTRKYEVTVKNLDKADSLLNVWETRGPDEGEAYDENWLQLVAQIDPTDNGDGTYTYNLTMQPYSIVTVTSLIDKGTPYVMGQNDSGVEREVLDLPYTDDFEYEGYELDEKGRTYLERRGNTPRYTTDMSGAFEVAQESESNHTLMQIINAENRPYDWNVWGGSSANENSRTTSRPNTVLGDHRWTNYTAGIDFKLDMTNDGYGENYAGLGVREVVHNSYSGDIANYTFKVYSDGRYQLLKRGSVKAEGIVADFDNTIWHKMQLSANENVLTAYLDGEELATFTDTDDAVMSGRVTLGSGFYNTEYDNLEVLPIEGIAATSTAKLDDTASEINWSGNWNHILNEGYAHYNRTRTNGNNTNPNSVKTLTWYNWTNDMNEIDKVYFYSKNRQDGQWDSASDDAWASASEEAYYQLTFSGMGVELYGKKNAGTADIYLNGEKVDSINFNTAGSTPIYKVDGLENTTHVIKLVCTSPGSVGYSSFTKAVIKKSEDTTMDTHFTLDFEGTGINIFGASSSAKIRVSVDGEVLGEYTTPSTGNRQTSYWLQGLPYGKHTIKVEVLEGTYTIDGIDTVGAEKIDLEVDKTLLEKELEKAENIDLTAGDYLESSCETVKVAINVGREVVENSGATQGEVDMARLTLKNAVLKLAPAGTIIKVVEELAPLTTSPSVVPQVPQSVMVETLGGSQFKAPIIWNTDMSTSTFATLWNSVTLSGIVEGTDLKVSTVVDIVPNNLVYFIDSGIGTYTSEYYERLNDQLGLENEVADKVYVNGEWGYVSDGISQKGISNNNLDKIQTGLYAAKGKEIVYKMQLDAGTYEFTGAFREWWNMNRYMKMYLVYQTEEGMQTVDMGIANLSKASGDQIVSNIVTLPIAGEVEYHVALASGTEAPVISWLAVNQIKEETEQITLDGPTEVTAGQSVEVVVGIGNIEEMIYAEDFNINYDEDLFELVGVEAIDPTMLVEKALEQNRVITASTDGISKGDKVIKFKLRAKEVDAVTTGNISVDAALGIINNDESKVLDTEISRISITIKPAEIVVDKSDLLETINKAKQLVQNAVVGSEPGEYPQEAVGALELAIQVAEQVAAKGDITQAEVNAATDALAQAIKDFEATANTPSPEDQGDINMDGEVNVADLALVAYYFHVKSTDTDLWENAKKADVNKDNIVDILDLTAVANKILAK